VKQTTAEIPRKRPAGPACRYHVSPPDSITLALGDIDPPERIRSPKFDPERRLTLPCAELFSRPQPAVHIALLARLAPLDITPELLDDESVLLPVRASVLAPRFVMQTIREVIEEPPPPEPPVEPLIVENTDDAPPDSPAEATASGVTETPPPEPASPAPPTPQQDAGQDAPPTNAWRPFAGKVRVPIIQPPAIRKPSDAPGNPPETGGLPAAPPGTTETSVKPPLPKKRQSFRILPVLKRKSPAESAPPVNPVEAPLEQAPADDPPSPVTGIEPPPEEPPVDAPAPEPAPPQVTLETPPAQASPEEIPAAEPPIGSEEHTIPDPGPGQAAAIATTLHLDDEGDSTLAAPCAEKIQELFLTEETLTLDRVLSLCGGLPGIRACILAKGSLVLGSHNVPDGIDLVSLTANAAQMLQAIRSSSMRMGLGSIPAITVHSEKGPVSFLHADDLALLVLHADRGFVPGVRERLHSVVKTLGASPLPLPVESTGP
jgi:predicted regulator of Ras-like GTPase activity (Roadblock/LC7/MglB family)